MATALISPVLHDIHVTVVSADGIVLGAHALYEALAEANRLLALY
jgi:hypothetical protein